MLSLAIRARIPILRARTSDILNLPDVLRHLAPDMSIGEAQKVGVNSVKHDLVYAVEPLTITQQTYNYYSEAQKVLLLINQGEDCQYSFDAGEIPVPKELMENMVLQVAQKKNLKVLMPTFNGLTLKGMAEVIRLTTARDKSLTVRGVSHTRAMLTGKTQGLGQINPEMPLYLCPPMLDAWVKKNKRFFLEAPDPRLVPRGILFAGEPGVGKSQGAKYIANEWGVPLYRLDMASALSKWVSESEANLARLLSTLDQEEPSLLLIDEAEKIFAEAEDQGTTARLLSQLLWWLQEHKSRVLVVMTTNNKSALPGELIRPGRIDTTLEFKRLNPADALSLALVALGQFLPKIETHHKKAVEAAIAGRIKNGSNGSISHAEVVQAAIDLIKEKEWVQF